MNVTGWTIGVRASGKFTARIWSRDANGKRQSAVILTPDGEDALFETQREARAAIRLFERSQRALVVPCPTRPRIAATSSKTRLRASSRCECPVMPCVQGIDGQSRPQGESSMASHRTPIASTDANAEESIRARINALEGLQERMKAANAAIRKHAKAGAEAQITALVELGIDATRAALLLKPDFAGRIGFASYELTNNAANIKRLKDRLPRVALVAAAAATGPVEVEYGPVTYREDDGRVWIVLPVRVGSDGKAKLRRYGFLWSPTRGAWVRALSDTAQRFGKQLAEAFGKELEAIRPGAGLTPAVEDPYGVKPPVRVDEDTWWERLGIMPPVAHHTTGAGESFRICEALTENIRQCLVRLPNGTYWSMQQRDTVRHAELCELAEASMLAEEPRCVACMAAR